MTSALPSWLLVASVLLGSASIAVVLLLVRDFERKIRWFGKDSATKLQEHDLAYGRLEGRVDDLAGRLAFTASERRDLVRRSQRPVAPEVAPASPPQTYEPVAERLEIAGLKEQLADASSRLHQQTAVLEESQKAIAALQADAAGKAQEVAELQRRGRETEELHARDAADLERRAQHDSEAARGLKSKVSELELDLTVRERDARAASARIADLEADLSARERDARGLASRVEELESELSGSERETKALVARAGGLEADLLSRDRDAKGLQARVDDLEADLAAHERDSKALATRVQGLERELRAREDELVVRDRELRDKEQELDARSSAAAADHLELEARVTELQRTLARRDEDLRESAQRIEVFERTATEEGRRRETDGAHATEIERELRRESDHRGELLEQARERESALSARAVQLEAELEKRDESLARHAEAGDALRAELASRKQELDEARVQREELERQVADQKEKVGGVRDHMSTLNDRVRTLESDLARKEEELRDRDGLLPAELAKRDEHLKSEIAKREEHLKSEIAKREAHLESEIAKRDALLAVEVAKYETALDEERRLHASAAALFDADTAERGRIVGAAEERCRNLEQTVEDLRRKDEEHLSFVQGLEIHHGERVRALERGLAQREGEIFRFQAEKQELSESCTKLSQAIEAGERRILSQAEHLAEAEARLQAMREEQRRICEEADRALCDVDQLVEARVLPVFRRRAQAGADRLPDGYLEGLEQGDLALALQHLLGGEEPMPASSIASLAARWSEEHRVWNRTPITEPVAYLWAGCLHPKAGFAGEGRALLVVFGAFADGARSVLAVEAGDPASKDAWLAILRALEERGLRAPRLVVADETLGLGEAIDEIGWDSARQRDWNRRTADVLALLPKKGQAKAADLLRRIANAKDRAEAKKLRDLFEKRCGKRNAKVAERLAEDWRQMTSYYGFPEGHWPHLRSAEFVESPFDALRLRSGTARPSIEAPNAVAILWKLLAIAEATFRRINAPELLPAVVNGETFVDGFPDERAKSRAA
jgi:chromosome segregation ATPase